MRASTIGSLFAIITLILSLLVPAAAFAQTQERPDLDEGKEAVATKGEEAKTAMEDQSFNVQVQSEDQEQEQEREAFDTIIPEGDHWIYLMGRNAIWGGVVGSLIGVGVFLVTGLEASPWIIAQFAGGGILIGAITGMVEGLFAPDVFALQNTGTASTQWVEQDLPTTVKAPVFRFQF